VPNGSPQATALAAPVAEPATGGAAALLARAWFWVFGFAAGFPPCGAAAALSLFACVGGAHRFR